MASYWTNRGKTRLSTVGFTAPVMRCMLVSVPPASAGAAADLNTVSQVVADELAGAGYARQTLAGKVATENDTADNAMLDATDPDPYVAINAGTIAGAWIYERIGGGDVDANDHLWMFLDVSDVVTNGGTVTLQFNVLGLSTVA